MKKLLYLSALFALFLGFQSCSDDDGDDTPPCTEIEWFADADGDGRGNPNVSVFECDQPDGFVRNDDDADDTCVETTWFADMDGDGLGNPNVTVEACTQPDGFVANADDDDDTDDGSSQTFTIWMGEEITFAKEDNADETMESNQDRITDNVWITRPSSNGGGLYNIFSETDADQMVSPLGTEWAFGSVDDIASLEFEPFGTVITGSQGNFTNMNMIVHLIELDVYVPITFNSWTVGRNNGGGFSYTRSTAE